MKIEVTQEDIDRGEPNSAMFCPVARALIRCGAHGYPTVSRSSITLGLRVVKPVPDAVREFVSRFDAGDAVAPFAFEIP